MTRDGRHRPCFFRQVKEIRSAMEFSPFFHFMRRDAAAAVIRGIPRTLHLSPIVWLSSGVDFGETVVDEGAVNFCFVVDLLEHHFAV